MKDDKVTMKIEKSAWKELSKFKVEQDKCKTFSDSISFAIKLANESLSKVKEN